MYGLELTGELIETWRLICDVISSASPVVMTSQGIQLLVFFVSIEVLKRALKSFNFFYIDLAGFAESWRVFEVLELGNL